MISNVIISRGRFTIPLGKNPALLPQRALCSEIEFWQLPAVWGPPIHMSIGVGGNIKTSIFMF